MSYFATLVCLLRGLKNEGGTQMNDREEKRKRPACKLPISEPLEKKILCAMNKCERAIEIMRSERQVSPEKLNQPVDL